MAKAWSLIKLGQRGFSPVEVLLAASVFGVLVVALAGAIIFGRSSVANAGEHVRASLLADEGIEAVRNLRDANYSNLTDGTYGLSQSGNQWVLSGSQDTNGIFTRQIIVSSNGTTRKNITSRVSWAKAGATAQVEAATQLTNWTASIAAVTSWANATLAGSYDASGTNNASKVAVQGNYAYLVRADGTPDFLIINISNPAAPTLVGSMSLTGIPNNIAVSGNYAYITNNTDTAEMQIINISNPATPTLTSSYNATGTGDGLGVFIAGTTAYLVRAADTTTGANEFTIVNVATPASPATVGGYNTTSSMREVYVSGNYAHVATDSDTQELMVLSIATPTAPTLAGSFNLSGTANALTIDGFSTTLLIGQGAVLHAINITTPATLTLRSSYTSSGTINDIDTNSANSFAFLANTATAAEFQVINIASLTAMTLADTVDISGTTSTLSGVAYDATRDKVVGASAFDTQELVIFTPN